MYAISHAATALALRKHYREAPLIPLLVSVQLLELIWVALHYLGIERIALQGGVVELGHMPFSHSIATGLGLSLLVWLVVAKGMKRPALGGALAIGVASHLALDVIQHQTDIVLAPGVAWPRFGLGLEAFPLLNLLVELAYGIWCWWYARGSRGMLIAIVICNLLDYPLMRHASLPAGTSLATADAFITSVVALQIVYTWLVVWYFGRERQPKTVVLASAAAR